MNGRLAPQLMVTTPTMEVPRLSLKWAVENWEKYNRIVFRIYPDCEGGRNIHLNLHYYNDGKQKIPDEYYREGTHEINLVNREWNTCYLEIGDLPRDKITRIAFGVPGFGKDRTTGDSLNFFIDGMSCKKSNSLNACSAGSPSLIVSSIPLRAMISKA
jgi:hypothetical protein